MFSIYSTTAIKTLCYREIIIKKIFLFHKCSADLFLQTRDKAMKTESSGAYTLSHLFSK